MTSQARTIALAALVVLALLLVSVGVLIGRSTLEAPPASSSATIMRGAIPVGVSDTPAGALAAADNYLAIEAQSDEQDPALFNQLVAQAFAPSFRATALRLAAADRAAEPSLMGAYAAGAHAIALVGARRLDSYTPAKASVTTWLSGVLWGPTLSPRQTWNLVSTTLTWQDGRWLVSNNHIAGTAPVPSIVYVNGTNNQAAAFSALNGMSAPYYGSGG